MMVVWGQGGRPGWPSQVLVFAPDAAVLWGWYHDTIAGACDTGHTHTRVLVHIRVLVYVFMLSHFDVGGGESSDR